MSIRLRTPRIRGRASGRGQALLELALVMPVLLGLIAALFQFGILFVAYLSLVHEGRDIGRYVAVHPDTIDGASCTDVGPGNAPSVWKMACSDAPQVISASRLTSVSVTPACSSLTNTHCVARTTGTQLIVTLTYNASSNIFWPTAFRLGPFFAYSVPPTIFTYDYAVMVEPH
jgi:Flp pilus assembly protein TadG